MDVQEQDTLNVIWQGQRLPITNDLVGQARHHLKAA